jgi:hypothetical protein
MTDTPKDHPESAPQHKKGRGRPKHDEACRDLLDRISNERILVHESGKAISVTKRRVWVRNVVDRGIAGDPECEKILIRFEPPDLAPPSGSLHIIDVDSDDEIPARRREFLRRQRARAKTPARSPVRFGRGRPRNDAPFAELVTRELNRRITVQDNGETLTMTKREAWMRRLYNDAIDGNARALRTYMKLVKPTEPPPKDSFLYIVGGR